MWQPKPKWVIEAGALSISTAQFASLSATSGQCTFQVQVPSTSVYLDRLVNWQMTCGVTAFVGKASAAAFVAAETVLTPGLDFALCTSPIHSLVTSLQAAIGDTQVTNNLAQTRELMSLLADTPANRKDRSQPSFLDIYKSYIDASGAYNNPLADFPTSTTGATEPNGAWPITFVMPSGDLPDPAGSTYYVDSAGNVVQAAPTDGVQVTLSPTSVPSIAAVIGASTVVVPVFMKFTSIEPLQLSPFIWQEVHERMTGLSQLQNINIIANMQGPLSARLLRWTPRNGRYIVNQQYPGSFAPFENASIYGQFLTPPIELMPIPPINTVDYQQTVSYTYAARGLSSGPRVRVPSQTLSLPVIPDYLVVAVVPGPSYYSGLGANAYAYGSCSGTFYLPISGVSVTWSNMSGLLSSQTQSQLFNISKANGLDMSYQQWRGYAQTAQSVPGLPASDFTAVGGPNFPAYTATGPGLVALTGGPLVLRPGKDITLETGQASGMSAGQWTVQFDVFVDTTLLSTAELNALNNGSGCSVTVLAVNGGFFATKAGSSRVVIGPVPAGTVANAAVSNGADERASGERLIGAGRRHKRSRPLLAGHVM